MDISSLASLSANQQQNTQRASARLQAAIAELVSGTKLNQASDDIASLSLATQLQTATAGFRQISANLAQAGSLTQVADGGIDQIQNVLGELRNLAQQAQSPTLNNSNRQALNAQFQQLTAQIDQIVQGTSFNGKPLLNGDLSGDDALSLGDLLSQGGESGENVTLSIDNLDTATLFNGQSLNILTADGAAAALEAISTALGTAGAARATVGGFQETLGYISASVDTVIINQEAARAVLEDTDFAEASTLFSIADLQRDVSLALAAQSNRLSPTLLKLIG